MNAGLFVVLEGLDGCGKSTQAALLVDSLRGGGREVTPTREPTDGPYGRRIREMARSGERVPPEDELGWFTEDRREHVAAVIAPALAAGRIVVCDRYYPSTVAYQGARGLDPAEILAAQRAAFPPPDLILLLEIDPKRGLARVRARGGTAEPSFEEEGFLGRVAANFAALELPGLVRVDASRAPDDVFREVVAAVGALIGSAGAGTGGG